MNRAVYKAYQSLLKRGEYPFFVINLVLILYKELVIKLLENGLYTALKFRFDIKLSRNPNHSKFA